MPESYVVTGTLTSAQTVALDEALPLSPTKVRVVVEPLSTVMPRSYEKVIADISARQALRRHRPRSQMAVDAALREERAGWDR